MKDTARAVMIVGWALACSEDEKRDRPESALVAVTPAGVGGAAPSAGSAGAAGASPGAAGAPAELAPALRLGEPLPLVAGVGEVPYAIGPNPYGIRGGGFLARAALGNGISVADEPGRICISGSVDEVPGNDYGRYWGVEIGFNLNQGAEDAGVGASPAPARGADAGDAGVARDAAPGQVALPWLPGVVIGFSFVIEGPTINAIRFKALPAGYDPALEASVFCRGIEASSGATQNVLFSEMTQYCWSSQAVPLPSGAGLANISWQLPADVAPAGARPFDWCLAELRPILAP